MAIEPNVGDRDKARDKARDIEKAAARKEELEKEKKEKEEKDKREATEANDEEENYITLMQYLKGLGMSRWEVGDFLHAGKVQVNGRVIYDVLLSFLGELQ